MDFWSFAVSAVCAGMLMPLAMHVRSVGHDPHDGVQRLHDVPTSRLGGVVVVVACSVTLAMVLSDGDKQGAAKAYPRAPESIQSVSVSVGCDCTITVPASVTPAASAARSPGPKSRKMGPSCAVGHSWPGVDKDQKC